MHVLFIAYNIRRHCKLLQECDIMSLIIEEEEFLKRALEIKVMVLKLDTTYSFNIWSKAIEKFG